MAEEHIPLKVMVEDRNDNKPYFKLLAGNTTESSKEGRPTAELYWNDVFLNNGGSAFPNDKNNEYHTDVDKCPTENIIEKIN